MNTLELHPSSFILHPSARPRGNRSPALSVSAQRGFSLVELLVVIGIIGLLVAIATPNINQMLRSNDMAKSAATFTGLMTMSQTAAQANMTPVALLIQRGYETRTVRGPDGRDYEQMVMSPSNPREPKWLDHQQARLVLYGARRPEARVAFEELAFRRLAGSPMTDLPSRAWVAPSYALDAGFNIADLNPRRMYSPADPNAAQFNAAETFLIVFDQQGGVTQFPASRCWYLDENQVNLNQNPPTYPFVDQPYDSARGALVYDRKGYEELPDAASRKTYLQRSATVIQVNRALGTPVEGRK